MPRNKKVLIGLAGGLIAIIIIAGFIVALSRNDSPSLVTLPPNTNNRPVAQLVTLSSHDYATIYPWMQNLIIATQKGFSRPEYKLCDLAGSGVARVLYQQCRGTMDIVGIMVIFSQCLRAAKGKAVQLCAATAFRSLDQVYTSLAKQAQQGYNLFKPGDCQKLLFNPQQVRKNAKIVNTAYQLILNGGPAQKVKTAFFRAAEISNPTGNDITMQKFAQACKQS